MTSTKKPMADIKCMFCGNRTIVGWNAIKNADDIKKQYVYYCSKCGETQRISDNLD